MSNDIIHISMDKHSSLENQSKSVNVVYDKATVFILALKSRLKIDYFYCLVNFAYFKWKVS